MSPRTDQGRTVRRLGMSDGVWRYSQQCDGLTPDMVGVLHRMVEDIGAGRIDIPSVSTGPVLPLDADGNELPAVGTP